MTESQCAPDPNGLSEEPGSIRWPAGRFRVRIPGAHALRLIISRTGRRVRRQHDTTRRRIKVTKGVSLIPNPKQNRARQKVTKISQVVISTHLAVSSNHVITNCCERRLLLWLA